MTKKLISLLLVAVLIATLVLVGCGNNDSANTDDTNPTIDGSTAISLVDMAGRTVTLEKPAEKVIVMTASACEIVYALGAGNLVVGRGEYCNWPAEVLAISPVASGSETNLEQIIALKPDLVLLATMDQTPEQIDQIEHAGIAVYVSDAYNIAETYISIQQIGTLLGRDAEAAKIVADMKAVFEALASRQVSGTIYFEVSPLEFGLWTAGSGTFMNEVAELIGLDNIFADVESWAEISEEQVLQRNPDYILTVGMYFGEGLTPDAEILSRASWQGITAVREGNIINLPNNELSRPGPRLAEGAQALYDFVDSLS